MINRLGLMLLAPLWLALTQFGCAPQQNQQPLLEGSSSEAPAQVSDAHSGERLFAAHCAACHDQPFYKAPSRSMLRNLAPSNVLLALNEGSMQSQGAALTATERQRVAEFVTGKSLAEQQVAAEPPRCQESEHFDISQPPTSTGWGVNLENHRFQPAQSGGLTAANVGSLEVKWSFAYPNAFQARSQPTFGGGLVFVGSQAGTVWALGAKTGCLAWRFQAGAEVRTGMVLTPWQVGAPDTNSDPYPDQKADSEPLLFFGDVLANVYAVDARTGLLRWRVRADEHRDATLTGTPAYHDGRLYVSVSSLEVVAAADPQYACCTFRGALLALDAATGNTHWKSFTIDEPPKVAGTTTAGTHIMAASGAPIWSAPTIDLARSQIYVGTGENYSSPADGNSDAIIAFDLNSGRKLWVSQQTANDAWNIACFVFMSDEVKANCPEENGPDYDFGSSPMLVPLNNGTDVVVGGQKSGEVMAVDPDTGATLWKTRVGRGGVQGGVHFGLAVEGERIYVPINDIEFANDSERYLSKHPKAPGVHAVHAATGEILWSVVPDNVCAGVEHCNPGVSHAITAIPGAVIAGYLDGRLRIYAAGDGKLLWERNMLGQYQSVSGAIAEGGSFSGGGVMVAHGLLYVNSGYGFNNHMPGNALVVLGPAP